MDTKALAESGSAAALAASGARHQHVKAGGGSHTHAHSGATEGHTHGAGSEDGHPDVALLPLRKALDTAEFKGWTADFEIKAVDAREDGTLILTGYGNTWDTDRDGETTIKGAFDHSLDAYLQGNPILLYNHKEGQEIGTVVEAKPDAKGLWVKAEVPKPDDRAPGWHHKVYSDIKRRILRAFSMGGVFHRGKSEATRNLILAVDLYEMSVVSIPANGGSLFDVAHSKGLAFDPESKAPRTFSTEQRDAAAQAGHALPDGSYPITDRDSLRRAIQAYGRNATPTVKAHIVKRAHALNLADMLPDDWKSITDAESKARVDPRVHQPGVGRGHGRHHHGPLGPRKRPIHHTHRRASIRHTHPNLGISHTDAQLADKLSIASEAAPAVRKFAAARGKDPMTLSAGEVRQAIIAANPGVSPAALGLSYTPPDTKADPPPDPVAEADEIEARGDFGELLEGLQEAVAEVIDRDDLPDQAKADSIKAILSEFVSEAQARVGSDTDTDEEVEPAKALAYLATKDAAVAQSITKALATVQRKETPMPPENQDTGQAQGGEPGTKGATVTIDAKQWDDTQKVIATLAQEKTERDMEVKAAKLAQEQIANEARAAEAKAAQEAADQQKMNQMVAVAVEQLRGGLSSGRKFVHPSSTQGNGSAAATGTPGGRKGSKNFTGWLRDLRNAKRGDYEAYQRLQEQQQKAAEWYATDGDGDLDTKALAEATTGAGGFLVPPQYWQAGIAEFRLAAAKIRRMVTVITSVNSNLVYIPRETGVATVGWTAENAAKPSSDQTFGQIAVNIFTLAGISKVSNQLLEDSSPAVDQIVRKDLGRVLGQAEDLAFINGSGSGQPTGILQTAGVLTVAYSAPTAGSGLGDAISAAITAVDSNFFDVPNAILAHPRMIAKLRQVKDTQGRYIFEPGFFVGGPQMGGAQAFLGSGVGNIPGIQTAQASPNPGGPVGSVWGLPVWSDANIPTTLSWNGSAYVAGGAESPIILGVWEEAYLLERTGVTLDVSNEAGTSFEQNQTWFRGEERLGFTAARQPTAFCFITGTTNAIAG